MTTTFARPQSPWALRLLPPFPTIANRILALVGQEDVNIHQVGDLIKFDPSFSAELLRIANSAMFGARREVASLSQAIILLGLDRVKLMATFIALRNMVKSSLKIPALRKVWLHSLASAFIAEEIAMTAGVASESAYTAGLLHNLGSLGLMSAYPNEYARMLEVSDDFGFDLLRTERELFDIDHCAAGAYLAQDWGFPDELAVAIATHHDEPTQGEFTLYTVIQLSWRLADTLGYAAFSPDRLRSYDELIAWIPKGGNGWIGAPLNSAKARLETLLADAPL